MKRDIVIKRKIVGTQTEVCLKAGVSVVKYRFETENEYHSIYINDENLSYYVAENNEDEEDDYLLYHALQEDKKLCATFFTRNAITIQEVFRDKDRYNIVVKPAWKNNYNEVFVSRKGCLSDYYNFDEIDEWYSNNGINTNVAILAPMFEAEMIKVLSGEYVHPALSTPYRVIINFDGDDVLQSYGMEGLIIAGLLLGYPLESTANLIEHLRGYFFSHSRKY